MHRGTAVGGDLSITRTWPVQDTALRGLNHRIWPRYPEEKREKRRGGGERMRGGREGKEAGVKVLKATAN